MKKIKEKKEVNPAGNRFRLIFLGSLFFLLIAIIIFGILFSFIYFFSEKVLKILFEIIIIGLGFILYFVLMQEFMSFYEKSLD